MPVSSSSGRTSRRAWMAAAAGAVAQLATVAVAQRPVHYFQNARQPLGAVAAGQLTRFPHMHGYVQPVEFVGPPGMMVSTLENGHFTPPETAPLKVGLQIGPVYRFKVIGIPLREGEELFPTVELINRLHPPEGQRVRFPIPIRLTREEMEWALDGNYVTRVIYLEDPSTAFPAVDGAGVQRMIDVGQQDPLLAADKLGRPMAILRIGSRTPLPQTPGGPLDTHCPPVERYPQLDLTPPPDPVPPPPTAPGAVPPSAAPPSAAPAGAAPNAAPGVEGSVLEQARASRPGVEPGPTRHFRRQPLAPQTPPWIARPPQTRTQR